MERNSKSLVASFLCHPSSKACGAQNIGNLSKDHCSKILNSADDQSSKGRVLTKLKGRCLADGHPNVEEAKQALTLLATGKSCGPDELGSEHFVYSSSFYSVHLSLCFSIMRRHNHLPAMLTEGVLVLLLKNKSGNVSDKDNYEPIVNVSLISKALEVLFLIVANPSVAQRIISLCSSRITRLIW